jgi:small neutral amino acid transporter SnatA (MarC family)
VSEYLRLLVAFMAAVNPPAVAASLPNGWRANPTVLAVAAATATAITVVVALLAERFLDWLQVEPETFRVAAGIVMALGGGIAIIFGRWRTVSGEEASEGWLAGIFPLAIPLVIGPWVVAALISYSVDHGEGMAMGAVLPAAAAGLALTAIAWRPKAGFDGAARIMGLLLLAIAAGLIVDGVRAI